MSDTTWTVRTKRKNVTNVQRSYTVSVHSNTSLCLEKKHPLMFLSVPLLYHSMGQINKSIIVVCLCMYLSVDTPTVAFFNRSSRNLARTFDVRNVRTDFRLRSKYENTFPYFNPKPPKFTAEIGNSQPNIKCKVA